MPCGQCRARWKAPHNGRSDRCLGTASGWSQSAISPDWLDTVRKNEYSRVAGRDRRYIKGQKYTLLSRWENLTLDGKKALKALLSANKRLNTAYVLKESGTECPAQLVWQRRATEQAAIRAGRDRDISQSHTAELRAKPVSLHR
jgi:hypothetical protein